MPEVIQNERAGRFEIHVDGQRVGLALYRDDKVDGRRIRDFTHTEIDEGHEGHGLAATLIRAALDTTRDEGFEVLPHCPFVLAFIGRHADYLDLVPEARRGRVRPVMSDTATVAHDESRSRFTISLDGRQIGLASYRLAGTEASFTHTEIDPRYSGRGLGAELVEASLDQARANGWTVLPYCSFVEDFIHPTSELRRPGAAGPPHRVRDGLIRWLTRVPGAQSSGSTVGSSWREALFMQKRSPVGRGPSLNTWPRWAPQFPHLTSVRDMPE